MMLLRSVSRRKFSGVVRGLAAVGLLVLFTASVRPVMGQAGAGASAANTAKKKLAFDAAAVRPSTRRFVLIGSDFLSPLSRQQPPKGGLFSWNVPLFQLIQFAYDLRTPQVARTTMAALPQWAKEEWYTVEARADGNPTREDVREMVRSLLEDRFQFAGHMEKRDGEVLVLEIAKPVSGLKPHAEGEPCTLPAAMTDPNKYPHAYPSYQQYPAHCGVFNRELSHVGERRLEMLDVTMQQIVASLSGSLPQSVSDGTGLTGHYDAVLDFGRDGIPQNADNSDELGLPEVPATLEKQLGLKLVKQKAQVDAFVIDHIARLSEN